MLTDAEKQVIHEIAGHASDEELAAVESIITTYCAKAWDNGVDTAGQYAEQPWVVDDECKPLNPYRSSDQRSHKLDEQPHRAEGEEDVLDDHVISSHTSDGSV